MTTAFDLHELGDMGVRVLDCEHKTPQPSDQGYPYIAIPDIQQGRVVLDTARLISETDLLTWTRRTVPLAGDVIVTRRGRVGDTAPIPHGIRCAIGQNLVLLRSDGARIDQGYLRWAARSPQWWSEVDRLMNVGAIFSSLNVKDISRIKLPVPRIDEQQAIAEVLGALDDKIAANTKLAATAMELASEIYNHGVAGFPDKPMDEVLTPILGGTPARGRNEFWGGNVPWASAKDVTGADMGVITDTEEKITEQASSSTKAKPLPKGSVILTARGTVGAVARLSIPASFNQSCYGFVPGALPPALLYFGVLRAANRAKKIAHGSVFDTITMKTFAHLPLPDMPDAEFQKLESLISPQLDIATEAIRENRTLAATRDALLPQLMSGRLRIRDVENTMGEMV